jgi:hypothetical protein
MKMRTGALTMAWVLAVAVASASTARATGPDPKQMPAIPGIDVSVGQTRVIPGATNTIAFRLNDGRIVVVGDTETEQDVWSSDGGRTWAAGPRGPRTKTAIDLGGGEVLGFGASMDPRADGVLQMGLRRSTDGGKTWNNEKVPVSMPQTTPLGGDDGKLHSGMYVHHGAIQLKNGDIMVSLYGNYAGDREFADAYPIEFNTRKVRTVVVRSSDKGKTWGNAVTVAYNTMLARGLDTDSSVQSFAVVPAVTQEGFGEADLARAPNGDILCMMRSGGRLAVGDAPIFPTPMYLSRSSDEGKTWTQPVQVADRGVCPYLVTLENGIIVCSYARPGGWLILSDDSGKSWKGPLPVCTSDSYCRVLSVRPDRVLVLYHDDGKVMGADFTLARAARN